MLAQDIIENGLEIFEPPTTDSVHQALADEYYEDPDDDWFYNYRADYRKFCEEYPKFNLGKNVR